MTTEEPNLPTVDRALNQLVSLIAGSSIAKETQDLADDPHERLLEVYDIALEELEVAVEKGLDKDALKPYKRRLGSLQSLMALSKALAK